MNWRIVLFVFFFFVPFALQPSFAQTKAVPKPSGPCAAVVNLTLYSAQEEGRERWLYRPKKVECLDDHRTRIDPGYDISKNQELLDKLKNIPGIESIELVRRQNGIVVHKISGPSWQSILTQVVAVFGEYDPKHKAK